MAALAPIVVTCPRCGDPVTVPVILTPTEVEVRHGRRGDKMIVRVSVDKSLLREHSCYLPDGGTRAPLEVAA